jgi:PucR family transcriptional regulator, purine catabolism regulatory protein
MRFHYPAIAPRYRCAVAPQPAFTLGDLLDQEALALEMCAGGETARGRRVAGAHSIEIERPSSWLGPDWVMLTTGARLHDAESEQRDLVAELDEAGAAALGFGLDLGFERVPPALLEEAERRGFPVFSVPLRTPFREIVSAINRALLSSDLRTYQRLSSMQLYLVDALREIDPRGAVVARLAELLDASVLVLSPSGGVDLADGDAPAELLWPAIHERPTALHELDVDGWHAVATPVLTVDGDPTEWLVVASRRSTFAHGLTKPVAQAAAPLLAATARLGETERTQARAVRAALLEELLDPGAADEHALAARAATFGLDFAAPARVVAVRGTVTLPSPHLALERDGVLVALVQASREELRERLASAAAAGIGRPVSSVAGVAHSHRDAELALQRVTYERDVRMLDFEDFELGLLLLAEAPRERIQPKVDEWTTLLRSKPMLWEAVVAYFEHDLDVVATAAAMHLHPNSLRYRLSRVEKLLGRSLKQPSTIASLYVAMLASGDGG